MQPTNNFLTSRLITLFRRQQLNTRLDKVYLFTTGISRICFQVSMVTNIQERPTPGLGNILIFHVSIVT